jgi:hypothetical protein
MAEELDGMAIEAALKLGLDDEQDRLGAALVILGALREAFRLGHEAAEAGMEEEGQWNSG